MFRKTVLAIAATAALGVAALAPTTASASHRSWNDGWSGRSGPSFSFRFGSPRHHYAYAPRCYIKRHWVHTRWGWRLRTVEVCR